MEIKTKYNIGDRVWVVYEYKKEVHVYSDVIIGFGVEGEKGEDIKVYLKNTDVYDYKESDLIDYDDKQKVIEKIEKLDNLIPEEKSDF